MKKLNEMIRQESRVRRFMRISEYLSSQKKRQYAYMEFRKNGIHVRISSTPCVNQDKFCVRVDDKLLKNSGIFISDAIKSAYGIQEKDTLSRYKEGRSTFWIDKKQMQPIGIKHGDTYEVNLDGKKLSDPVCVMQNADGSISLSHLKMQGSMVVSVDMLDRMVMYIRPAADYTQEELTRLVTESELKKYYGSRLLYLPYSKLTFVTTTNKIPRWFVDEFGGSLDCCRADDGGIIATPVKAICPFTREQIDYKVEKPVEVAVSEETNEHLEESSEIVKLLLVLKEQYGEMEALVERLKKENKRSKKENAAYRKFLTARGENPDNVLLSNL